MEFSVKFNCDNAAFDEDNCMSEIADILRNVASKIESEAPTGLHQNIRDSNGNVVGTFKLSYN